MADSNMDMVAKRRDNVDVAGHIRHPDFPAGDNDDGSEDEGGDDDARRSSLETQSTTPSEHHNEVAHQFMESMPIKPKDLRNFARFAPLVSAVLAPISTLLDIPALTQHWFYDKGIAVPDPKGCIALSAIGLAFNVFGNLLLIARFSTPKRATRAVTMSLQCWVVKVIIALINISYFGGVRFHKHHRSGWTYDEGFWCAVVSVIISGIISTCLTLHYFLAFRHDHQDSKKIRITGRKFMMSITGLFCLIGFQALAYSCLEHWKYFDAIYFSVQTTLTVGYGDLVPTTTWGKILLFPFAILTIAQLANQISIIIDFIKDRAEDRRDKWRKRYSVAMHRAALQVKPYGTLIDEICLIHQIELHQQSLLQLYDLIWSFSGLITFYVIGALIFHAIERWGYGDAVYAVVVLSTSIGLGDFTPKTSGGRVFWVVYALMCVPIITSFATNTVTGIMYTITEHKYQQSGFRMARAEDPEAFAPHSHFILKSHEKWDTTRVQFNAEQLKRKEAIEKKVQLSRKQEAVLNQLFNDPETHDIICQALNLDGEKGEPEQADQEKGELVHPGEKQQGDQATHDVSSEGTRVGDSPPPPKTSLNEFSKGGETGCKDEEATKVNVTRPQLKITTDHLDHPHTPYDDIAYHAPADAPGDVRVEIKLARALVDRVTHLEAQARQMLVDTMDETLPRTVLLADRNLQVRDALHLFDFGIDLSGTYQAEAEAAWREAVAKHGLGDASSADKEDMLSRVRRYRDTFAEILVLSSTLLQLEGDDLKRFERWRTGDLHTEVQVEKDPKGELKKLPRQPKRHRKKRKHHRSHTPATSRTEQGTDSENVMEHHDAGHTPRSSPSSAWTPRATQSPADLSEPESGIEREEKGQMGHGASHFPQHLRERLMHHNRSDRGMGTSLNEKNHPRTHYTLRAPGDNQGLGEKGPSSHPEDVGHPTSAIQSTTIPHHDPCGAANVPTPPLLGDGNPPTSAQPRSAPAAGSRWGSRWGTGPTRSATLHALVPSHALSPMTAPAGADLMPSAHPAIPTSAHPACAPTANPPRQSEKHGHGHARDPHHRFIDIMAKSVLKAADREANDAREGWKDWLADKAYDVISDAGHVVHVRHGPASETTERKRAASLRSHASHSHSPRSGQAVANPTTHSQPTHPHAVEDHSRHTSRPTSPSSLQELDDAPGNRDGHGEEAAAARANDKFARRLEQIDRQQRRLSLDSERSFDGDRPRLTLREHVLDVKREFGERREERKERKEREEAVLELVDVPDPEGVPVPEGKGEPVVGVADVGGAGSRS